MGHVIPSLNWELLSRLNGLKTISVFRDISLSLSLDGKTNTTLPLNIDCL